MMVMVGMGRAAAPLAGWWARLAKERALRDELMGWVGAPQRG